MPDADKTRVRTMIESDLDRVLAWRNHPGIRDHMLTRHEITSEEHQLWFDRASGDANRRLLILEESNLSLGFMQFSGVTSGTTLTWGFYTAPAAPSGSGKKLGQAALQYAFEVLGLHKVCGQALETNNVSINFHKSLGFKQEGRLREQHRIDEQYHDLIYFGLLKSEWLQRRQSDQKK